MKLMGMASAGILMTLLGCSGQSSDDGKTGTLALNLIGTDRAGEQYRLRNASFDLYGFPDYFEVVGKDEPPPPMGTGGAAGGGMTTPSAGFAGSVTGGSANYYSESFSSEEDPDSATISRRLVPGYYYLTLSNSDFYMEHLTPSGPERVEKLVLLSGRTTSAYIWNGGVTDVAYQFGINGDLIDFRSGELRVNIGIEHPGENMGTGGYPIGGFTSTGGSAGAAAGGRASF
ncbi:MAG TPA: hypothetical protein VFQ61_13575 [Polyangiaceae bacterium]|nr:hypothetical protein [Polyangiaceae bacterium]